MKGFTQYPDRVEIVKIPEMTTISTTVTADLGVKDESTGRSIVPAGTVLTQPTSGVKGLLLYAVDVTDGDQAAPLLVEGVVWEDRLPAAVSAEDKAAMPNIIFG